MAISYRSTPKRKPAKDRLPSAILTREDFEDAVSAINTTLADLAKQTGINRQYLSEFKCGDRNLRPEHLQKLRDYFEAQGVEFFEIDAGDEEDLEAKGEDAATERRPRKPAPYASQIFPLPSIAATINNVITDAERKAAMQELDAIVRENDEKLSHELHAAMPIECEECNEELISGLAAEAVLRRVLDGSFTARKVNVAKTQAELIAQQFLSDLPADTEQPTPAAPSTDAESVAADASAKAAGGTGAKPSTGNAFLDIMHGIA